MSKNKNILVFDFSNLAKRCIYSNHVKISDTEVDYNVWKYTVFNSIYLALVKFKAVGCILALDDKSWRKTIYKPYKLDRKVKREKDIAAGKPMLNWEEFTSNVDSLIEDFKSIFPFKILKIKSCEADDVIATVSINDPEHNYIIISVDQDFMQLLDRKNIKIYEPIKKAYRECSDVNSLLLEYCICGQSKDNIYNVLTSLDFPLSPIYDEFGEKHSFRKPVLGKTQLNKIINIGVDRWLEEIGPKEARSKNEKILKDNEIREKEKKPLIPLLNEDILERYNLNKKIISFDEIPKVLINRIMDEYNNYKIPDPSNYYTYFNSMGWRGILESYEQVESTLLKLY